MAYLVGSLLSIPFAGLVAALSFFPPVVGLIVASGLAGLFLVWLYGKVSDQGALRAVKRRVGGALLEIGIFRHDLWVTLRAQGRLLRAGVRYLALAVPPVLILAVPGIIIGVQLFAHYGVRGGSVTEPIYLSVDIPVGAVQTPVHVSARDEETVIKGPVRDIVAGRAYFEVYPASTTELFVTVGEATHLVPVTAAPAIALATADFSTIEELLFPPRIVPEVALTYPWAYYLNGSVDAAVLFIVVSFVVALGGAWLLRVSL